MATNKRVLGRIGFYLGLALFLIITLFPFFVMLMTVVQKRERGDLAAPDHSAAGMSDRYSKYIDIFNPLIFPFVDYFRNSMVVSLTSSVIAVFLGTLGAYALSKLRFKGRTTINASSTPSICSPGSCWWCRCSKSSPRSAFMTPNWR
jgi:multiple sugar transport system permease protein